MASYDKAKLTRLLERRRAAYITLRDYNDRAREAREALGRHAGHLRACAAERGAGDAVDSLMRLPLAEAGALTRSQVESHEIQRGGNAFMVLTGVGFSQWREYLALRGKAERLQGEADKVQQSIEQQFGILPSLLEAVKKWGFANPELEVI